MNILSIKKERLLTFGSKTIYTLKAHLETIKMGFYN